ncbi:MAG: hypothetical protein EOO63_07180 [Hymenobacter sp.]|nr:MAG: hypothetical protein EOO63_07180 [Hymenobacter sp.]
MWSELRKDIEAACNELHISKTNFRPLPHTTDWHQLEERIYSAFCKIEGNGRPCWLWDSYRSEWMGLWLKDYPDNILNQLVPTTETVWFMTYDGDSFLFYEGKIEAIQQILLECSPDEYYLINKKYEWLLGVNHHDSLTGTGEFIISQLKAFAQRSPELLTATYPV